MNLLDNAIKFTKYGSITLSLSKESADSKITRIKFTIKDTGIGMTIGEKQSILNSFSQANSSIERKYGGSGLGLFISSKILELMESNLEISSKAGEGSEFSFILSF
jgi:signal transduction histidine kinase